MNCSARRLVLLVLFVGFPLLIPTSSEASTAPRLEASKDIAGAADLSDAKDSSITAATPTPTPTPKQKPTVTPTPPPASPQTPVPSSTPSTANQIGRLTSSGNGLRRTAYEYDELGRATRTINNFEGQSKAFTTGYGYPQSQVTLTSLGTVPTSQTFPDNERVDYTYDASGAQQSIKTTPSGGLQQTIVSSIFRNSRGQTIAASYGNGAVSIYKYNESTNLRLNQIQTAVGGTLTFTGGVPQITGGTTLQDYGYTFDNNGNIIGVTDAVTTSLNATYGYDSLDQLTSMTPAGQALLPYSYDRLANLTNKENVVQSYGGAQSCEGCPANRGPHALASAGGVTYNYDFNGNLVSTSNGTSLTSNITWNAENMATRVVQNGVIKYQKYFLGESLWKKVEPGLITHYLPSLRMENGQFRKFFGSFAERSPDGSLKFYHGDHLGSASLVTNLAGQMIRRQAYKPYGEDRFVSGTFADARYQFNFKEKEESIGFYDYGARLYNPGLGRWVSPDVFIVDGLNRYAYVRNNPLRYNDPTGHFFVPPQSLADWAKEKAREKAQKFVDNHFTVKGFLKGRVKSKLTEKLTLFLLKAAGQGEQVEGESLNIGITKLPVGLVHTGDIGDVMPNRVAAVMTVEAFANDSSLGFRSDSTVVVVDASGVAKASNAKQLASQVGTRQRIGIGQGPFIIVEFTPATVNMDFSRNVDGNLRPRFTQGGLQEFRVPNASLMNLTNVSIRLVNENGNFLLPP